jgi:hypothetical protein
MPLVGSGELPPAPHAHAAGSISLKLHATDSDDAPGDNRLLDNQKRPLTPESPNPPGCLILPALSSVYVCVFLACSFERW